MSAPTIPADFPVQPVPADWPGAATCGSCSLSWDDSVVTSYTPAPSARCPFEAFHGEAPHHTVYQLARLAEVADPDSTDSPGARWLRLIETTAADLVAEDTFGDGDLDDQITATADDLVPVYTHDRWLVFVDLAAYAEYISDNWGPVSDLTEAAGIALFQIAERLLRALLVEEA